MLKSNTGLLKRFESLRKLMDFSFGKN